MALAVPLRRKESTSFLKSRDKQKTSLGSPPTFPMPLRSSRNSIETVHLPPIRIKLYLFKSLNQKGSSQRVRERMKLHCSRKSRREGRGRRECSASKKACQRWSRARDRMILGKSGSAMLKDLSKGISCWPKKFPTKYLF